MPEKFPVDIEKLNESGVPLPKQKPPIYAPPCAVPLTEPEAENFGLSVRQPIRSIENAILSPTPRRFQAEALFVCVKPVVLLKSVTSPPA